METAIDFGKHNDSCSDAMEWRRSLPEGTTQAEAYLLCERGDWVLWQLEHLPKAKLKKLKPTIDRIVVRIVSRTIRRGLKSLRGIKSKDATEYRRWAKRWLSGEDRSYKSADAAWTTARDAAWNTAWDAAWAAARNAASAATWDTAWAAARDAAWAATRNAASTVAWDIAWNTVWASAWTVENKLQLRDIRSKIPEWPRR